MVSDHQSRCACLRARWSGGSAGLMCPRLLYLFSCTEEITEGIWSKKANRKVFGQWISSSTLNMSEAVKGFLVKCCAYNSLGTSCETILLNSPGTRRAFRNSPLEVSPCPSLFFGDFYERVEVPRVTREGFSSGRNPHRRYSVVSFEGRGS